MSRVRFARVSVAALTVILVVAGCAGTTTKKIELSPAEVEAEELKQRTIVLETHREQEQRLADVAFPILRGAVPLCGEDVTPRAGFGVTNLDVYEEEWREPARAAFGLDSRLRVATVAAGSPAAEGGLEAGDVVVELAGEPAPSGEEAVTEFADRVEESLARARTLSMTAQRDGSSVRLRITPAEVCDFPAAVIMASELNAYADGEGIFLTSSMMRFADDHELSVIVAHELAHNAMDHIDKRKKNAILGAIAGVLLDVATTAATGYNTGGANTAQLAEAGAKAFSQDFETEADYVGLYAMALAGLPLEGAPRLWRHMAQASPQSIGLAYTHPTTVERFLRMERAIEEIRRKEARGLALRPDPKDPDAEVERPTLARETEPETERGKAAFLESEARAPVVVKMEEDDPDAARVTAEERGPEDAAMEEELRRPEEPERTDGAEKPPSLREIGCTVAEVEAGDRFFCEETGEVTLAGVRALAVEARYGRIALQSLRAMLRPGSAVRLLVASRGEGRAPTSAFVFVEDGTFVNGFLAARGYVYPDLEDPSTEYESRIQEAAGRAETKRIGVWSPGR